MERGWGNELGKRTAALRSRTSMVPWPQPRPEHEACVVEQIVAL